MFVSVLSVVGGLALLMLAADRLVVSAVRVSHALGVSAVLVGALVVGLGTSVPELLVSTLAAADNLDVAMANVVGSNITNVTLVLGAAALVGPVAPRLQTLHREGMLMLGAVGLLLVVLIDGTVALYEGWALLVGLLAALYLLVRWSMDDSADEASFERGVIESVDGGGRTLPIELAIGVVALVVTVYSAKLLLDGALEIGQRLDLSGAFLGVLLGVGTSLPELATALAAIRRDESDLVVGNVLGSNIFNSLAVAGTAGLVGAGTLETLGAVPLWIMVGVAFAAGVMSRTGSRIARGEAVVLLAVFFLFTASAY